MTNPLIICKIHVFMSPGVELLMYTRFVRLLVTPIFDMPHFTMCWNKRGNFMDIDFLLIVYKGVAPVCGHI